jgi:hypothetical protein
MAKIQALQSCLFHLLYIQFLQNNWGTVICTGKEITVVLEFDYLTILRNQIYCWAQMAHACNPSYSGGRDQENCSLKPAQANSSRDPILKNPITKNWAGRVAQVSLHKEKERKWNKYIFLCNPLYLSVSYYYSS